MIKQDDIFEVRVEKLVYEGAGLGFYDGRAVFVKGVLPDEIVRVRAARVNKNYIKASLIEFIEKSKKRIIPKCPLNKPCGGCDLGFAEYNYQIELKEKIIKEIFQDFKNTEFKPAIKSPLIEKYRCKTQYPASETKNSKRVILGYYKEKTHEITDIKFCPVQPPVADEIINFVRQNWKLGCYVEKKDRGLLKHVNMRISSSGREILLTLVLNSNEKGILDIKDEIVSFSNSIKEKFPFIKGIFANLNNVKTNKITGEKTVLIEGESYITEKLKDKIYKIGSDSFFQVNPKCAELLFDAAAELIEDKGSLLDLYGGCGTIGIYLKDKASKITLVEENKEAVCLAKENYKLNNVLKYEVFEGKAKEVVENFIKNKKTFKNIVIDPPRKGSDDFTLKKISEMTNSVIYISCNPMTLKRDAGFLVNLGYNLVSIQPADMFPNTHHIEVLAYFKRET